MSKVNSSYFGKEFGNLSKDDKIAYKNKVDSVKARLITGRVISAVSPAIAAVIVGIALAILFIPALVPALAFVGTAGAIGILASGVVVLVGGLALGLLMFALSKKAEKEAITILYDRQPQVPEALPAPAAEAVPVKPDYISDDNWQECSSHRKQAIAENLLNKPSQGFLDALILLIKIKKKDSSATNDSLNTEHPLFVHTQSVSDSVEASRKSDLQKIFDRKYDAFTPSEKKIFDQILSHDLLTIVE